ncbi:hypothetical protein FEP58_06045 [Burkholderia multivorans]|nr:hypothetical protein [Burkholderia multivorans]
MSNTCGTNSGAMPCPVSVTVSTACVSSCATLTVTSPPAGVNFSAFDTRLDSICRSRSASPETMQVATRDSNSSAMPVLDAAVWNAATTSANSRTTSTGIVSSRSLPVDSDDASRMSPTMRVSERALRSIASIACTRSASSPELRSTSIHP